MALALVASLVTFGSTFGGGYVAMRWPARKEMLMALAGGVVLAAALADLLPEALERAADIGMSNRVPLLAALGGYLFFHIVERYVHRHGEDGHDHDEPDPAGLAGATGFVVHSFFDGLAIGLAFQIDSAVGIVVALAVIGHDFSDGLNTVSYLEAHRHPEHVSRRFLIADALAPMIGALVGLLAPVPDEVFPIALGFFSGLFVFAASTNLLPAAEKLPAKQAIPITALGAAVMVGISLLA
jgi:zinc transporter, ZIP family